MNSTNLGLSQKNGDDMKFSTLILTALLALPLIARAEVKKAADVKEAVATTELRANEAFNRGQYSLARELFTKVSDKVKDDKTRYGAIQEQIRVCETKIKEL